MREIIEDYFISINRPAHIAFEGRDSHYILYSTELIESVINATPKMYNFDDLMPIFPELEDVLKESADCDDYSLHLFYWLRRRLPSVAVFIVAGYTYGDRLGGHEFIGFIDSEKEISFFNKLNSLSYYEQFDDIRY